jgi:ubiquinone/menaquinone biosynthesis C-methylase UbiE
MKVVQPTSGPSWEDCAALDDLAAVIDPVGSRRKNLYIHTIQNQALRHALRNLSPGWALDFGCGTGRISRAIEEDGWRVTGVDVTFMMLAKARRITVGSQVAFVAFDGLRLPFPAASFDLVLAVYTLQLLMPYPNLFRLVVADLRRVLKPRHQLVLIDRTDKDQLSFHTYQEQFAAAGFRLAWHMPVRLQSERFLTLAQRRLPLALIPLLARLGRWVFQRKYERGQIPSGWYWDHLYIFEV